jgi:lipoprotein-releasing system permease protein
MENNGDDVLWLLPALAGLVVALFFVVLLNRGLAGEVARRYLTHFKLTIISTITVFAVLGITLAVAALTTVTGISTGFQAEFQRKVLGVNAHVLVLKYLDFSEYREVMDMIRTVPGVAGVNPFVINEMMVVSGPRIAGVLLKGVDPELMPTVLDLPHHIVEGSLDGLRVPGRGPPEARNVTWRTAWTDGAEEEDEEEAVPGVSPDPGARRRREAPARELDDAVAEALGVEPEPRRMAPTRALDDAVAEALGVEPAPRAETPPTPRPDVPGVSAETPGEGLAAADEDTLDDAVAEALGVEPAPAPATPEAPEELPGIVLGRTLASELDARVGDTVRIVTPLSGLDVSLWAPEAQVPRSREFRVVGLFYSGFDEYDTRLVYVDLYEAQSFYDHGDVITGVEIRLDDPDEAKPTAQEIDRRLGGTPYRILDWEELNHNLFTALRIQKVALTVVVSALVLVSGLLIIATLVLMIFEKKRDIAILKAMGATNGSVMRIFVLVGSTIGALGTFLGVALGYGVCRILIAYGWPLDPGVYLIDHLPVEIELRDYLIVSGVALGISVLSTVFPSWLTAATMKPVDGLRYE